jgi:hypothetical protein
MNITVIKMIKTSNSLKLNPSWVDTLDDAAAYMKKNIATRRRRRIRFGSILRTAMNMVLLRLCGRLMRNWLSTRMLRSRIEACPRGRWGTPNMIMNDEELPTVMVMMMTILRLLLQEQLQEHTEPEERNCITNNEENVNNSPALCISFLFCVVASLDWCLEANVLLVTGAAVAGAMILIVILGRFDDRRHRSPSSTLLTAPPELSSLQ